MWRLLNKCQGLADTTFLLQGNKKPAWPQGPDCFPSKTQPQQRVPGIGECEGSGSGPFSSISLDGVPGPWYIAHVFWLLSESLFLHQ